jgi:folate-binding protein YgfZ
MVPDTNSQYRFRASSLTVIRSDDYGAPGFEVFVPAADIDPFIAAARAAGAQDVDAAALEVTRVEAGRPAFGVDMDEHTIPLEAGIEDRAISLTKGCYVGQEVIIRVLHRGHGRVAKRLAGLIGAAADGPLTPGTILEADGKPVGSITSAVESPRLRRPIALGYVHRDFAEPGRVLQTASATGGRSVTVVTTPFVPTTSE